MRHWKKAWHNLRSIGWQARRLFPQASVQQLEQQIALSEREHAGQLRFVLESALDWRQALHGMTARERALQWFGQLRIWDTEHNSGVLVYVLLAERRIEIIADRGIDRRVPAQAWQDICASMQQSFAVGDFMDGLQQGLWRIHALLIVHAPAHGPHVNELPDTVIVR